MSKKQHGFAILEGLLILIIITVISGVSWYAIHTKHQTDKILAQSEKTSQNTPSKMTSQKYLVITEWNVKLPYENDTLSYKIATDNPNITYILSKKLIDQGCTDFGGGIIRRLAPNEDPSEGALGQTTAAVDAAAHPGRYGHAGSYYYEFMHDQSACSADVTANDEDQVNIEVENLVPQVSSTP